ncbi:MAG: dehydrogenase subunit [Ignavibacteria bacterium]|nr:dehydrogenase subunit [Ignavibacteria bacterium]
MGNYFRNIWLGVWTVLVGMRITINHLVMRKVTNQYPDRYPDLKSLEEAKLVPTNSRNRLFVDKEDCNGCKGCERDCPVNCISVETTRVTPGDTVPLLRSGGKRNLWVTNFTIDMAKCCFCSLCTQACPTSAIVHTSEFEYSEYNRNDLVYQFSPFSPEEAQVKKDMFANYQAEQAAKKAAAAAVAPAPAATQENV